MKNETSKIYVNEDRKAEFSLPYEFPMRLYHTDLAEKPMGINSWHWHEELQFCIVDRGELVLTAEGRDVLLKKGEGFFIPSGMPHTTRAKAPDFAAYRCLNAAQSVFSAFHGSVLETRYVLPYAGDALGIMTFSENDPKERDALRLIREIFGEMEAQEFGYELSVCGTLLHLWKVILEIQKPLPKKGTGSEREAKRMLKYITDHFSEDRCLRSVSGAVHMSASECCRVFRKAFGCTMTEYLEELRIDRCAQKLAEDPLRPVCEIAYEAGFHSPSYFTKRFRMKTGKTPTEYRNIRAENQRKH